MATALPGFRHHYGTLPDTALTVVGRDRRGRSVTERSGGEVGAPIVTVTRLTQSPNGKFTPVCDDAQLQRDSGVNHRLHFHNHYLCDRCPLEWDEYAACEGPAWCPCCDEAIEPYDSVDLREDAA